MCKKFTPDELNKMDHETKNGVIYQMQDRLERLEQNYENLIEQIRLANQQRFGRHTEKLDDIAGQLSFFNEAEANYDEAAKEPTVEDVIDSSGKVPRKPKKKGQREEDLNNLRGLTLLRKNKLSKEITNKTGPIVPIVFGSILR